MCDVCVLNTALMSAGWIEAVVWHEVSDTIARLEVFHSYPEGIDIDPHVQGVIGDQKANNVEIEVVYRRVAPDKDLSHLIGTGYLGAVRPTIDKFRRVAHLN